LTSSTPIIPEYRGLTVAGNVLDRDEFGQVYHTCVVDTTLGDPVQVSYDVRASGRSAKRG